MKLENYGSRQLEGITHKTKFTLDFVQGFITR